MLDGCKRFIAGISTVVIRGFPVLVLACLLVFPAYKTIWAGYVSVFAGLAAAGWVALGHRCPVCRPGEWTTSTCHFLFYAAPALVQLALIAVLQPVPMFDGLFVYQQAGQLLATGEMDPLTYYPPAQTWWYASWFAAFGVSPMMAQLSHVPLSMGVTWAVRGLAREVYSEQASRLAALMVAWYPAFIAYVLVTPYYHYLYTFATVWMVWQLVRFWKTDNPRPYAGAALLAGLAAGVGALSKAVQLIAPLQAGTWLLVLGCVVSFPRRKGCYGLLVFCAGMAVVLSPWVWRNWLVFGDVVPVCTSGGLVLYSANNPESNGLYSSSPDEVELESPRQMLEHSRWCADRAKEYIVEDPVRFAGLAARKFLHTWGSEATFTELINWRGQSRPWIKPVFSAVFLAAWSVLVGLWVVMSWRQWTCRAPLSPLEILTGVLVLSNAVVYLVFEGGDRHHLPLVPLIAILLAGYFARPSPST